MALLTDSELAVSQRFNEVFEVLKAENKFSSEGEFCTSIGIVQANFSKYKRNERLVPLDALIKMIRKYRVSEQWLLRKEGDMFLEGGIKEYTNRTDSRVEEQAVPLYEHEAAAGLTKLFSNAENVLDYIRIPNLPKCDGAVHISGDSMYPLLKSGDIVMYKQVHDILNGIFWGEMYLLSVRIDDEDYTLVKYIHRSDLGNEYVCLASQNKYHSPKDVLLKNIRALGLIKASIRINSMA